MDILEKRRMLAMLRAKGKHKVTLRKPGAIRYPSMIERGYARILMDAVDRMAQMVRNDIIPKLYLIVLEAGINRPEIHKDAWTDRIQETVDYGKEMAYKIFLPLAPLIETTANTTSAWNHRQITQATERALGAPLLVRDTFTPDVIKGFIQENVSLIKNIADDSMAKIQQAVYEGIRNGQSVNEISSRILETTELGTGIMEKAKNRANLIARDQIGKLNGQLTMFRQEAMGISRYRWRTMMDERVRAEHKAREGMIFSWDKPPRDGHPGVAIGCRCYAEPMFEDILPELEM